MAEPAVVRDPVCGMSVNHANAKHSYSHSGKNYSFCCQGCLEKFKAAPQKFLSAPSKPGSGLVMLGATKPAPAAPKVKDLVCGMDVDPATSKFNFEFEGKTYRFCSAGCLTKFRADPPSYLEKRPESAPISGHSPVYVCPMCPEVRETKPVPCPSCGMALEPENPVPSRRTEYTCPMHPEIVRSEPGSCPICGMALEPRTVSATQEENPELRDMTRRFWVGVVLTTPLLAIAMGSMVWPEEFMQTEGTRLPWLEFVLATPVVLWCGLPFFQRFWASLVNRSPNMFTLIGLGTGVAYIYSVVATLAPGIFPESLRKMGGSPDVYFEAAAAITTLVLLGQVMELRARSRTSAAIRALLDLSPKTARVISSSGEEKDVPLDQVHPGDKLRVRPGEQVPVDGIVVEGRSSI